MIEYRDTHEFSPEQLQRLFRSVGWSSGEFPDKLVIAMGNYETVLSAWDGDDLVGMVCAMDDGIMTALCTTCWWIQTIRGWGAEGI